MAFLFNIFCFIIPRRRRRDIDLTLFVRLFVRPGVTNVLGLYLKDYYRFEHETAIISTSLSMTVVYYWTVYQKLTNDFGGFSLGDLLPRQAKIRQTVGENAPHGMLRTFVCRGEKSPCENTTVTIEWVFAWRFFAFCPENTLIRHGTNQQP